MDDKLLRKMAEDLKITPYKNEYYFDFESRVIYSAMASWIKVVCMDKSVLAQAEQSDTIEGVSKVHVLNKCKPVLDELLKRFPSTKAWFEIHNKHYKNAVEFIRSSLLSSGELVNVGFDTQIALAKQEQQPLTRSLARYKGIVLGPNCFYSGIATLAQTAPQKDFQPEQLISAKEWFLEYIKNAWWKPESSDREAVSYFNPYYHSKSNAYSWQDMPPKPVKGIVLFRRIVNKYDREYVLYHTIEKEIHRIDPVFKDFREYRRIIMGMRAFADNPVPLTVKQFADHTAVSLNVHLPRKEFILLKTYAWPESGITDKLNWNMAHIVWDYIKPYFEALDMQITEEYHG